MSLSALLRHETVLALLVVVALATLAVLSDRFFTAENLLNQGRLMAEVGLVALAMTFVIVTAGIDLACSGKTSAFHFRSRWSLRLQAERLRGWATASSSRVSKFRR
jgi:ribose/xylose/arabinose/galactoside ABC-type transport system permease subunit